MGVLHGAYPRGPMGAFAAAHVAFAGPHAWGRPAGLHGALRGAVVTR